MPNSTIPAELICRLRRAERVAVLTGAGISAESGVPTFRDAVTGLWAHYRPEDLATPEAYARDPQLVWNWYQWRRGLVAQAQPNAGHMALAQLEARFPAWTLITQNVDNLHQRAGNRDAIRLHGDILRDQAFYLARCGFTSFAPAAHVDSAVFIAGLLDFSFAYQGAADQRSIIQRLRRACATRICRRTGW